MHKGVRDKELKGLNNSFKVIQLAFTISKIITNVVFMYIYSISHDTGILCIVFQQNVNLQGIFSVRLEGMCSLRKQEIKN